MAGLQPFDQAVQPLSGLDDVRSVFRGERGSVYALHGDGTTTGYRTPSNQTGSAAMQPRSAKSLFLEPRAANAAFSWFQDPHISTHMVPEMGPDGKSTGHMLVQSAEDQLHGGNRYTKGQTLSRVPFSMQPSAGLHPVEIYNHTSPLGNSGTGVHVGNRITDVGSPPWMKQVATPSAPRSGLRALGRAVPVVGAALDAANVADVALDPNKGMRDLGNEVAGKAGRWGSAAAGAALGAPLGPLGMLGGGALGYYAGDRAVRGARQMLGMSPDDPSQSASGLRRMVRGAN